MSVNAMTFEQAAAVLNSLAAQATGQENQSVVDLSGYISVGQRALLAGYDPLAIGISQMVNRTIFAYRPYTGALSILDVDDDGFGAITRKVNALYMPVEEDGSYALTDGQHNPDMFDVRKPKLYQTNFYGYDVWNDHVSITRKQLKNAVTSPADMGRLMDLVLGTKANEMEISREGFRRATLANVIGAVNAMGNTRQVRHLLTEYNAATGQSLTSTTVRQGENYANFVRWAYAQIAKVSDMLRNPSSVFHLNPTQGTVLRHHQVPQVRAQGGAEMQRIETLRKDIVEGQERLPVITGKESVHKSERIVVVKYPKVLDDISIFDIGAAESDRLVEDGQRIAHRSVGLLGYYMEGFVIDADILL